MKKFLLIPILFLASTLFAEPCLDSGKLIEEFFEKGSYVKLIPDESKIHYGAKSSFGGFYIDSNTVTFYMNNKFVFHKDEYIFTLPIKKYDFSLDENSNLIIKQK